MTEPIIVPLRPQTVEEVRRFLAFLEEQEEANRRLQRDMGGSYGEDFRQRAKAYAEAREAFLVLLEGGTPEEWEKAT